MQHGRVVETGPTEEVLRRPRDDYTRMLIALGAEPRRRRRASRCRPAPLALADRAASPRPMAAAASCARSARVRGRRRRQPAGPARRDAGHRRRIRLRQVHRRALHRAPDRSRLERRDPAAGSADIARLGERRAAPAAQAHPDRVPGPLPVAQPAPHRRRVDRRRSDEFRPAPRTRRSSARGQLMRLVGLRSGRARSLPAPVLRRPAPAHLHRPRARHGARRC